MSKTVIQFLTEEIRKNIHNSLSKKPSSKTMLMEALIDDLDNFFGGNEEVQRNLTTAGSKVEVPFHLKAAMLLNNISEYDATMLDIFTDYDVKTPGADENPETGTIEPKRPVTKTRGAERDIRDFTKRNLKGYISSAAVRNSTIGSDSKTDYRQKRNRVPVVFVRGELQDASPSQIAEISAYWVHKDWRMISYDSGTGKLTPLGKAQLEFLARAATKKPADNLEKKLFNLLASGRTKKGEITTSAMHFSEVAKHILRTFYEKVMIQYVTILTKRQQYHSYDSQAVDFIRQGVDQAIDAIDSFDPGRGNIGSFIISIAKNHVKTALRNMAPYRLDEPQAYKMLQDMELAGQPLQFVSKANPEAVAGGFASVKPLPTPKSMNGREAKPLFMYTYNTADAAFQDLTSKANGFKDAAGGRMKPSPLAKEFLTQDALSKFFKSNPTQFKDIEEPMGLSGRVYDSETGEPGDESYTGFGETKVADLSDQAKAQIMSVLNNIFEQIVSVSPQNDNPWGVKNIRADLKANKDFIVHLMFKMLNYGSMINVYKIAWELPASGQRGITTNWKSIGEPVVYDAEGNPAKNVRGESLPETDIKSVWSVARSGVSGQEVKNQFLTEFLAYFDRMNADKAIKEPTFKRTSLAEAAASIYTAIRKYFGAEAAKKGEEPQPQNMDQFNTIRNNISNAMVSETSIRKQIRKILKSQSGNE